MGRQDTLEQLSGYTQDQRGLVDPGPGERARHQRPAARALPTHRPPRKGGKGRLPVPPRCPSSPPGHLGGLLQLDPQRLACERDRDPVPDAIASHATAAHLYGLGVLFPRPYEFTVPAIRRTRRKDLRLHVAAVGRGEWESLEGLPVTRPLRSVADLPATHHDPDHIGHVMVDALERRLTTEAEPHKALAKFSRDLGGPAGDGEYVVSFLREQSSREVWAS